MKLRPPLPQVGVAYHHSGMLPVLREFVELCFQNRLVQVSEHVTPPSARTFALSL